ncbi:MAG: D-alanyl-D-alanine carboxypeptidase family protein [Acidimicrobiales bacterium]
MLGYRDSRRRGRRYELEFSALVTVPRTILTLALVVSLSWPVAVGAQSDVEQEREEVRDRRSAIDSELDVLQATDAEVNAALDELEASIAAQKDALARADAARVEAEAAVLDAEDDLRAAQRDVSLLIAAIREMAIASYIHPPTVDLVHSLEAVSFSDALLQRAYLDARANRDVGLLELLEQAEQTAADRAADLETAAADAARAVEVEAAALDSLRDHEIDQERFAVQLRDRIDASLAEAAVLADLDADLAAQIQAEQAALIARIPPPPVEPVATPVQAPTTTTSTPPASPGAPATTAPTTTALPTAAPTTTVPRSPPTSSGPTVPVRTVQGITVHANIADDVDALLTAARADGVPLSGWGYRSADRQIQLRAVHCGPTYYDIWLKPASLCSPPTAAPGRSLHEQGRAIDFTHNGRTITSRSTVAFRWLAENAASYGLYNLPSEPWHWSTNGS